MVIRSLNPIRNWRGNAGRFSIPLLFMNMEEFILLIGRCRKITLRLSGLHPVADGYNFDERPPEPIYTPRENFEAKLVPGGNSGCEDPRLTRIDDTIYMLYTAFNGRSEPRVALTYIKLDDFITRLGIGHLPVLVSPPNLADKDAALFPKLVKGKYAFLHRMGESIWLDYVDDLQFKDNKWLKGIIIMSPKDELPDTEKIGISGPPIETKEGWLLLYHCVSRRTQPMTYYVAAALLDLKDPSTGHCASESANLGAANSL